MKYGFLASILGVSAVVGFAGTANAQAAPNGEQLFRQRCQICHTVAAGKTSPMGPNLAGVVGRKAASTGFNYSAALKKSNLTWTSANIDKFLTGPSKLVPGTRMAVSIADPAQRAALVSYLSKTR